MKPSKEDIIKRLTQKSSVKYRVYDITKETFETIKSMVEHTVNEIHQDINTSKESPIPITFNTKSQFELEMRVAGDLILMHMHTNIFKLPGSHFTSQSSYIKQDPMRSYCGIINIYNFIADSFKYNRYRDTGELIGRLFINKDRHFFVEGKKQLGYLFNDFARQSVNDEQLKEIIRTAIVYSIDFDLTAPPLDSVKEITVGEMNELNSAISLKTGKKLGFRFNHEQKDPR